MGFNYKLVEKNSGKLADEPTEEQIENALNYTSTFRVDYKRCAESLKKRGLHISQNITYKIYQQHCLFVHEPRERKEQHIH